MTLHSVRSTSTQHYRIDLGNEETVGADSVDVESLVVG